MLSKNSHHQKLESQIETILAEVADVLSALLAIEEIAKLAIEKSKSEGEAYELLDVVVRPGMEGG
jgi:hypothetical protein